MNFSPFGGHFPASIPTIHQFAAKFGHHDGTAGGLCPPSQESASSAVGRYPTNTSVPSFTQHHPPPQQHIMPPTKYQGATTGYINQQYQHQTGIGRLDKRQGYDQQQELAQELCAAMLHGGQQQLEHKNQQQQQQQTQNNEKIKQEREQDDRHQHQQQNNHQTNTPTSMPSTWQSLAAPGSTVADYLSHLPASTLPISLHHFLKYSAENIKKESVQQLNINNLTTPDPNLNSINHNNQPTTTPAPTKKKKKKKAAKEKKPRPKPGEIRLTTALDGSTLYCCPECHMAYPEKELLEQHLVGHTLERRFVCDICGAGLKRKDHLTRHKQSHNPERPYVCTVCLKAFKRKEQLTLHFVIHSGEKRHICPECGKGFYRKDHLRKHTRSHIARRVKAELSQQGNTASGLQVPVAAPGPPATAVAQALLS